MMFIRFREPLCELPGPIAESNVEFAEQRNGAQHLGFGD